MTMRKVPAGRRWKRECCDHCGKRDGDRAPDGRILLVFQPGVEGEPKLCAPCLEARRPTLLDLARRRKGESDLEVLTRPNPLLQDLPYAAMPDGELVGLGAALPPLQPVVEHLSRTVGGFDPHARSVPFTFVDPLEQLEVGRG